MLRVIRVKKILDFQILKFQTSRSLGLSFIRGYAGFKLFCEIFPHKIFDVWEAHRNYKLSFIPAVFLANWRSEGRFPLPERRATT